MHYCLWRLQFVRAVRQKFDLIKLLHIAPTPPECRSDGHSCSTHRQFHQYGGYLLLCAYPFLFWTFPFTFELDFDFWTRQALSRDHSPASTWIHFKAEGEVEFKSILFTPSKAPFDLYDKYYGTLRYVCCIGSKACVIACSSVLLIYKFHKSSGKRLI